MAGGGIVSQDLMDYIAAAHAAVLAVLGMLTAEHQLSDEDSSVLAVLDGEREIDAAAAKLAAAAGELPQDRKPAGWDRPPAPAGSLAASQARFVQAALRVLSARYADGHSSAPSENEYAWDQLALAARDLAADADADQAAKAEQKGRLL